MCNSINMVNKGKVEPPLTLARYNCCSHFTAQELHFKLKRIKIYSTTQWFVHIYGLLIYYCRMYVQKVEKYQCTRICRKDITNVFIIEAQFIQVNLTTATLILLG